MATTAYALHILVKHKEIAEDIIKQLAKGAKFQTLAKKYSSCPSGKKGGDLGTITSVRVKLLYSIMLFKGLSALFSRSRARYCLVKILC